MSPVRTEHGDFVTCIVRDLTARKQSEEALRQSNREIVSILENITDAFFALDRKWRFTYLNRKAEQMIARSREDLIGKNIWEEFPELAGTAFYDQHHKAVEEQTPVEFSMFYPPLSIWVETHVYPSETGLSVYLQDITARKHLEEQFQQSQKLEALGRLAGGVAHDFNNLLTIIGGYGRMALDSIEKKNPFRQDFEAIVEAANRASALTRQLLAFSRRQHVQPKVLDLNRLVNRMNKMLRRLIREDIDLRLALAPDLGRIKADPGQLEQVIMNLAVNARDAMPGGGRLTIETVNLEVRENAADLPADLPCGSYIVLSVSDTGTGMTPEIRSRIFEPFFTTKPKGKGTGLGLSTVYGIVKQSGGGISVETEIGRGTTFRIYVPRTSHPSKQARTEAVRLPRKGTETILLVEDEPEVRKLAREMLMRQGYTVLEACDGPEALETWARHPHSIDLALTDVIMPQMSGFQLAERLIAARPALRVLYMTGYSDDVIAGYGVVKKEAELLRKPFTSEALARKVRQALDDPQPSGADHPDMAHLAASRNLR